jgi:nicotinate-nucleotide pyrophosphorylase (carboxylating)
MSSVYDHPDVAAIIRLALEEDLRGRIDITCGALVPRDAQLSGVVRAKEPGVVCGLPIFAMVFAAVGGGVAIQEQVEDGRAVAPGDVVLRFTGNAQALLTAERTALNLVQRMSGTATSTRRLVDAVAGTRAHILDTRKTTPGMRVLQKHAVLCGGGMNHRHGLHDAVLIKENHIALMPPGPLGSGPAEAVRRARGAVGPAIPVEVEIEHLADLAPVIAAGANIVLLDNMGPDLLRQAVALRDRLGAPVELEASGGINLTSVRAVAETGVERISTGSMTHSVAALDLSMRCSPC